MQAAGSPRTPNRHDPENPQHQESRQNRPKPHSATIALAVDFASPTLVTICGHGDAFLGTFGVELSRKTQTPAQAQNRPLMSSNRCTTTIHGSPQCPGPGFAKCRVRIWCGEFACVSRPSRVFSSRSVRSNS